MSGEIRGKKRRAYRPGVEGLEVLPLLSSVVESPIDVAIAHEALPIPVEGPGRPRSRVRPGTPRPASPRSSRPARLEPRPRRRRRASAGLAQLDRYLARAWFRAGIAPQQHDDCTQGRLHHVAPDVRPRPLRPAPLGGRPVRDPGRPEPRDGRRT